MNKTEQTPKTEHPAHLMKRAGAVTTDIREILDFVFAPPAMEAMTRVIADAMMGEAELALRAAVNARAETKTMVAAMEEVRATLAWVRSNYASGSTRDINARLAEADATISDALAQTKAED